MDDGFQNKEVDQNLGMEENLSSLRKTWSHQKEWLDMEKRTKEVKGTKGDQQQQ